MPWTYEPPQNVSKEHFWLQHLARSYLYDNRHCSCVAIEVVLPCLPLNRRRSPEAKELWKYRLQGGRVDVVGVGPRHYIEHRVPERMSMGIEVKVSRADFLSGFRSDSCNLNYVLAPAGMIKKTEMPEGCGLLVADRDGWAIRTVRRATYLEECAFSLDTAIFAIATALTTEYGHRIRCTASQMVTWTRPISERDTRTTGD